MPSAGAQALLAGATVGEYLVNAASFLRLTGSEVRELGGGVSNVVLSVDRGGLRVVVTWPAEALVS